MAVKLSVIVPLGPDEVEWHGLVPQLGAALPHGSEVIIVAAGPPVPKPHADWPEHLPLRHFDGGVGRARQLNRGAWHAEGEWLWFLHADSRLGPRTVPALLAFLARGETALGWFDLAFRPGGPALMRLNAYGANLRSAWLGMPFGDQGFVMPSRSFAALGGFREDAPYGEDHLLAWTARRAGIPLRRIGARLFTSARKYERGGWSATTARHLWLTAAQAWPEWRRLRGGAR
jgi:hypothetical protein